MGLNQEKNTGGKSSYTIPFKVCRSGSFLTLGFIFSVFGLIFAKIFEIFKIDSAQYHTARSHSTVYSTESTAIS